MQKMRTKQISVLKSTESSMMCNSGSPRLVPRNIGPEPLSNESTSSYLLQPRTPVSSKRGKGIRRFKITQYAFPFSEKLNKKLREALSGFEWLREVINDGNSLFRSFLVRFLELIVSKCDKTSLQELLWKVSDLDKGAKRSVLSNLCEQMKKVEVLRDEKGIQKALELLEELIEGDTRFDIALPLLCKTFIKKKGVHFGAVEVQERTRKEPSPVVFEDLCELFGATVVVHTFENGQLNSKSYGLKDQKSSMSIGKAVELVYFPRPNERYSVLYRREPEIQQAKVQLQPPQQHWHLAAKILSDGKLKSTGNEGNDSLRSKSGDFTTDLCSMTPTRCSSQVKDLVASNLPSPSRMPNESMMSSLSQAEDLWSQGRMQKMTRKFGSSVSKLAKRVHEISQVVEALCYEARIHEKLTKMNPVGSARRTQIPIQKISLQRKIEAPRQARAHRIEEGDPFVVLHGRSFSPTLQQNSWRINEFYRATSGSLERHSQTVSHLGHSYSRTYLGSIQKADSLSRSRNTFAADPRFKAVPTMGFGLVQWLSLIHI
eukprot:TRINITY_DN6940_c0_g1_i2.p1 TRINITY_DN6940_c0_g1~~TRINITY_DN6940_c0_g1_i2.p1  ORF type:complete len:544 (+),score=77.42 TRINITY_DN6940_c0_g1_i2:172-1803(+)